MVTIGTGEGGDQSAAPAAPVPARKTAAQSGATHALALAFQRFIRAAPWTA
jgi:hypothetical protein